MSDEEHGAGSTVTVRLADFNQLLVCPLCDGYFRDAMTMPYCGHSFCKVCVYRFFNEDEDNQHCPTCNYRLAALPKTVIKVDRTLQGIVDALLPKEAAADKLALTKFHEKETAKTAQEFGRGIKRESPTTSTATRRTRSSHDDAGAAKRPRQSTEADGGDGTQKGKNRASQVCVQVKPASFTRRRGKGATKALVRPYLRTSGRLKLSHLAKYLAKKLDVPDGDTFRLYHQNMQLDLGKRLSDLTRKPSIQIDYERVPLS